MKQKFRFASVSVGLSPPKL